jgi:hypothetical protein
MNCVKYEVNTTGDLHHTVTAYVSTLASCHGPSVAKSGVAPLETNEKQPPFINNGNDNGSVPNNKIEDTVLWKW